MSRGIVGISCFLLLVVTMIASDYFASQAKGFFYTGAITASPESRYASDYFSVKDVNQIQRLKSKWLISYEVREKAILSFASQAFESEVIYTTSAYFQMVYVPLVQGAYLPESKNDRIVISEDLALKIFGYLDVVGNTLTIEANPYTVVGVAKSEGDMAWLKGSKDETVKNISRLYWKLDGYNKLDAFTEIDTILATFGNSNIQYQITDLDSYANAFYFRNSLFNFVIEIAAVAVILLLLHRYGRDIAGARTVFKVISTTVPVITAGFYLYRLTAIFDGLQYFKSKHFDFFSLISNRGVLYEDAYLTEGLRSLSLLNSYQLIAQVLGLLLVCVLFVLSSDNQGRV